MSVEIQIFEFVLRLIGAFYFFGSIIGARMITRYSFFDQAIEAISGKPTPWAERFRERLMLAGLAPIVAGGLALMFLSPFATWLFGLSAIWQAVYLGWFAPRYLDPHDDPGEEGRAKTWRAFWGYLIATALVLAAAFAGILRGPGDILALGGLAITTAAFAGWIFWSMRNKLKQGASPFAALSTNPDDPSEGWDDLSESGFKIREPKDISVVLRPSWNDGYLFHTDRDDRIGWGWQEEYLSQHAQDMMGYLGDVFRDVADPYDPRRCALRKPEDVEKLKEAGAAVLEVLQKELGAERVRFDPLPTPVLPESVAQRVKIEPYHLNAVIWSLDEPISAPQRPIYDDLFGISWALARHLSYWAEDWRLAQSEENENPETQPSKWTDADFDKHEEEGRVLAVRLKRELVATDRAHVMVYYMTRKVGLLEAHADEEIPPLPGSVQM
jgi:hypothetical protein